MAILCHDLNLLFVLTPATGSTAIARLLLSDFGGVWLPGEESGPVPRKHSTLRELMETGLLSAPEREKLCVVTSVRNPYDRLVSMYYKRRGVTAEKLADPDYWMNRLDASKARSDVQWIQRHSFTSWIRRRFLRSWLPRRLRGRTPSAYDRFVEGVDVVLRYEDLQKDFDRALGRVGAGPAMIPLANVSPARPSRDYRAEYDPVSRALVRFGQNADLTRFDYEF